MILLTVYGWVYLILAICLILYSVCNRLDLLCIAAVCYIVYTMYCIQGIGISGFYRPNLSPKLYYAVYLQILMMFVFIAIVRYVSKHKKPARITDVEANANDRALSVSFRIYIMIIAVFALVNIVSVGLGGFVSGKNTVWEQTNVFYIVSLYGAWPAFAYGIHKNDKMVWIPSLLIELTIFFAGSRAFTATIIVIFLCEKGTSLWKNRKGNLKIYFLGAVAIIFLLLYRMVDQQIMAGDFSGALNTLSNPLTWLTALEFNEPRVIIANYDYALTCGVHFPVGDVIYRIIDFIPGLTSIFDIHLSYPEYYSTWLMNQVHGSTGVGGSIWGECYTMIGFVGIVIFTVIWLAFIYKCNKHLDYHKNYSYFVVSLGTYLAWYINRLDFNRVAQVCKVMLLCFLILAVIYLVLGGVINIGRVKISIKRH